MSPDGHRLTGRRVVVTGAGGISSATAGALLAAGARVHVIDRDTATLESLRRALPGVSGSSADLAVDDAIAAAFDEAASELGGLDGLVAVAGGSARRMGDGPVDALSREALDATLELNLATASGALREFLRRAERPGSAAVLIGSTLGRMPASPLFATHGYAAAKAAIEGLARSAAAHYAHEGVTVNVVAPGLTRTPMSRRAQEDAEVTAYATARQPLADGGFVDPDDVADACCYLLGARVVTGQTLYVDGGWGVSG